MLAGDEVDSIAKAYKLFIIAQQNKVAFTNQGALNHPGLVSLYTCLWMTWTPYAEVCLQVSICEVSLLSHFQIGIPLQVVTSRIIVKLFNLHGATQTSFQRSLSQEQKFSMVYVKSLQFPSISLRLRRAG